MELQLALLEESSNLIQVKTNSKVKDKVMEIVCITSFPGRECGIATFAKDLREGIVAKFGESIHLSICAIDNTESILEYEYPVEYILASNSLKSYRDLADAINKNQSVDAVLIQHEFGLFGGEYGENILQLLQKLEKPVFTTFHTILPNPTDKRKYIVQSISDHSDQLIVMTNHSANLLEQEYSIDPKKIEIIPHGTHLISLQDTDVLKAKYALENKKVLCTFGLLSEGKGIETALFALPEIIAENPDCIYLIIGKTHPEIVKREGEKYRNYLNTIIDELGINDHVLFIDRFVSNEELLEYLQLTDIYLFTSKDPNQAVSGTFSYAMGCNCPIISTQIPQAIDYLTDAGIVIGFNDFKQLSISTNYLFKNIHILHEMRINALQKIRPSAWQNVALKHMHIFSTHLEIQANKIEYTLPDYNLNHINNSTNIFGIIQFSLIDCPDINSGFTVDDNARALTSLTEYYELTNDTTVLPNINTYFTFIENAQQPLGDFLNYKNEQGEYTEQNYLENLEDSIGRALNALGHFYSKQHLFNHSYSSRISALIDRSLPFIPNLKSPRSIAFTLKGLYQYNKTRKNRIIHSQILKLSDHLMRFYKQSKQADWFWFEDSITYGNAILPEALLYAYELTKNNTTLAYAKESFDFLLDIHFKKEYFRTISNRTWYTLNQEVSPFGEQPIDVAYTIIALEQFSKYFPEENYLEKMKKAFNWYLGDNHLKQIIYNPLTGGCCDGLEHDRINLNQGAESTVTYLLARNCMERINNDSK